MAKKKTSASAKASIKAAPVAKKPAVSAALAGNKGQSAAVITQAMVSKRAYEIWISKGRPAGRDQENWQQAERELRAEQKK